MFFSQVNLFDNINTIKAVLASFVFVVLILLPLICIVLKKKNNERKTEKNISNKILVPSNLYDIFF